MSNGDGLAAERDLVARACRVLAHRGLVDGILGHVSLRIDADRVLVRGRRPTERGLRFTEPGDVRLVDLDGNPLEGGGWDPPKEAAIHLAVLRHRPGAASVVHGHPRAAVLCGLAGLTLRPVFGAFDIPAMRMAAAGVPVFPRPVLVTRPELGDAMVAAMDGKDVVLLRGHGITVAGTSVEQAVTRAVDLDVLCRMTVDLARLGSAPEVVSDADMAELPDLGGTFNDTLRWQALVADAEEPPVS